MTKWSGKLDGAHGNYIIAQDYKINNATLKRYRSLSTFDELVDAVQTTDFLYEVMLDEKIRVYFDIDCTCADSVDACQLLRSSCSVIKQIMSKHGFTVKRKQMRFLSACTSSKVSFHVIVPHIAFRDTSTRKQFGRSLRAETGSNIDPAPYSRNGLFRCPLSSKLGKLNRLIPVTKDNAKLDFYNIEEYLVHSREDTEYTLCLEAPKFAPRQDISTCSVEHVKACLHENGDSTSVFDNYKSHPFPSFYFRTNKTRQCLVNNVTHEHNNFIVYCGHGQTLVYKCFAPECTQHKVIGNYGQTECSAPVASNTYNDARCRPFALYPNGKLQIIQSEMGTGKTYQIRKLLTDNTDLRVLIVCFRVELGQYMCTYLGNLDFVFYRNLTGVLSQPKLICQVNSMHRIYNATYDVLILDEIESIIEQFSGVCATRRRMCWLVLEKLIRDTPNILALDACIADRSLEVLQSIRTDTVLIRNVFQSRSDMKMTETNNRVFFSWMISAITAGRAIAITSTSASLLVSLEQSIRRLFPSKRTLLIWSQSTDFDKRMYTHDLSNVDVFMYSATLQAGISIDILHFSKLFVYITANGPTPQSLHQMLARIRHFHDNEICMTFDKGSTVADHGDEWSYEQMVNHLTTPVDIALDSRFSTDMGAVISGFAKDWSRVYSCTPFFVCTVHNILQSFNGTRHFRKLFIRQALSKGYDVKSMTDCWDIDEQATHLLQMTRTEMKLQKEEHYQSIATADSSNCLNAEDLRKQADEAVIAVSVANETLASKLPGSSAHKQCKEDLAAKKALVTEIESNMRKAESYADANMQKVVLAQFYGVSIDKITLAFLKKCEPVTSRDAFLRLCLTVPHEEATRTSVQNRITWVMSCEGSHLTSNGIMYCVENLARCKNGIKLALCHQMLNDLGFEHIFDRKTVDINFDAAYRSISEHKGQIASAMQLREAANIGTLKDLIKFCNSVLYRCYRTRIVCSKKKHVLKHFTGFPPYRFVQVSASSKPLLVSDNVMLQAKLRI